ncbi:MAG: hypothetical protein GXO30_05395 [Epsilonproteobacteria bacterium]|nr:hypothetical protein [Campylobacterota bacterium]
MKAKFLIPLIAFILISIMGVFVLVNPSYEKSIKAKYHYEIGEYKEALSLAKEAFNQDLYNRMASTIMAQSIISLKYVSYNNDAKKYMLDINKIATQNTISDADKAKIRTMCEIMIKSYAKLSPSVITDNNLVQKSAKYNDGFEKLLEKVTK